MSKISNKQEQYLSRSKLASKNDLCSQTSKSVKKQRDFFVLDDEGYFLWNVNSESKCASNKTK